METEMNTEADAALVVNKYVLSAMGQWPYQTNMERRIIRIIGNVIMITANLSSLIALYNVRNDFDAVIEQVPMCMTGVFYFINFCTLVMQTSKMRDLLDDLKQNFQKIKKYSDEEFTILKQHADKGKFVVLIYCLCIGTSVVGYCLFTLTPVLLDVVLPLNESRPKNYLYDVDYVLFQKEDGYYFIFCHSFIAGVYCIFSSISVDIMLYLYLQHAFGMFKVLGYRFNHIMKNNNAGQTFTGNEQRKLGFETKSCIELYNNIVVFTDNVESCFASCLTFTMGVSATILSFQGVMVVVKIDQLDVVMKCATNFIAQAFHLFYNCFTGQILLNSSGSVLDDIYSSDWYVMSQEQKKLLLMMMIRSQQDCKVTIGKFFILSMETYSALMKTVFSYLSVLISVRA